MDNSSVTQIIYAYTTFASFNLTEYQISTARDIHNPLPCQPCLALCLKLNRAAVPAVPNISQSQSPDDALPNPRQGWLGHTTILFPYYLTASLQTTW